MQSDRPRPKAHYLHPAKRTTTPDIVYVFDSETEYLTNPAGEVHTLRLWSGVTLDRTGSPVVAPSWRWHRGRTGQGLASSLNTDAHRYGTVTAFAHNLGFDLATTRLPAHLFSLGWEVQDFAVSGAAPWIKLAHGKARIVLCDSVSWLPWPLAETGRMVGIPKPRLPGPLAGGAAWAARCKADVRILATALTDVMAWHDRDGGGPWSLSGTATAWGHVRARIPDRTVVIDPDTDARARDRQSIYGGRRTVWRTGEWTGHRYLELDLVNAYPVAATCTRIPARRRARLGPLGVTSPLLTSAAVGLVASVTVHADRARYPWRWQDCVWYPTGEFTTTLAGPELADAHARGDILAVHWADVHDLDGWLAPWGRWAVGLQDDALADTPQVVRAAMKRWGRTVIGRTAGHGWTREPMGPAPGDGWGYEPSVDMESGLPASIVDLGGTRYWCREDDSSQSAYPAVLAWIEARVRVALTRALDMIGEGAVLCADTDGMIATERLLGTVSAGGTLVAPDGVKGAARTRWVLDRVNEAISPFTLRIKRCTLSARVDGPQHVMMGGQRKLPGIPGDAVDDGAGSVSFLAWPTLAWTMQHAGPEGYVRPEIVRRLPVPHPAGWLLDDGAVVPVACRTGPDGVTMVRQWLDTPQRPAGGRLGAVQHPALTDLAY